MNAEKESERSIIERTLMGKARMNPHEDIIADTGASERARIELGAGDVPEGLGEEDDEQVAVRHADASGVTSEKPARRGQNERHPRWQKRTRGSRGRTT